jgi:hypothetical protein
MGFAETEFNAITPAANGNPPGCLSHGGFYWPWWGSSDHSVWSIRLDAYSAECSVGPFSTFVPHNVTVWAMATNRPEDFGADNAFGGRGAIGNNGEWVKIIDISDDYNAYNTSAIIGNVSMPTDCGSPFSEPNPRLLGHTHLLTNTWYQAPFSIKEVTNFSYCTVKYW